MKIQQICITHNLHNPTYKNQLMMTPVHSVASSLKLSTSSRWCTYAKGGQPTLPTAKVKETAFGNGFAYGWANFGHMTTGNRMLSYDKQISIFQVCGHNNRITNANNDCDLHAIWN
jgi:hypothetical protein